jgi:flagellar L-ring protein precursor FlgH
MPSGKQRMRSGKDKRAGMPAWTRGGMLLAGCLAVQGCAGLQRLGDLGKPPEMTKTEDPTKDPSYRPVTMPMPKVQVAPNEVNALWRSGSRAFFKDQRAAQVGDIVTVVVSMTDSAKLNNVTSANRTSGEQAGIPDFAGLTSRLGTAIGDPSKLISLSSSNNNVGTGQIQRNEAVTLRLAGIVTQVLPNGNLVVAARQEFVVNSELRELKVTGVIRPQDIASDNTVLHDRMAEARIQYGGRGQMTDVQTARWGQQLMDVVMPF